MQFAEDKAEFLCKYSRIWTQKFPKNTGKGLHRLPALLIHLRATPSDCTG